VQALPPFHASAVQVTAAELGASWHAGCPVGPSLLRTVHVSYVGFDGHTHAGAIVVHRDVVGDVTTVFRRLYSARFPIRRMEPVAKYGGSDRRSMAADNTSAFNCRFASAPGPKRWSAHAFGKAIDLNTIENPYVQGNYVSPAAGRAYLERARYRPGMAVAGGVLVRAFASVGWFWGGRWAATPDYQHFSATGG
jgi:hypothetical protein